MSPVNILPVPELADRERLVNNQSVSSFNSEANQLTITRSKGDRRYSKKMSFQQSNNNKLDIVITNEELVGVENELSPQVIGSRDIRKQYSVCAKLGLSFVLVMVILMLIIMIIALLTRPGYKMENSNNVVDPTANVHPDKLFVNDLRNVTSFAF